VRFSLLFFVLALLVIGACAGDEPAPPVDLPTELATAPIEPQPAGRIGSTSLRSVEPVMSLAWTPDDRIVSGARSRLEAWDGQTGARVATLRAEGPLVTALAASDRWLAAATGDGRVELWAWPPAAGGPARYLGQAPAASPADGLGVVGPIGGSSDGGLDTIYDLAWSPDGGWLASAHGGWMDPTGHRFREPTGPCGLCVWSDDGERIATPIPGPARSRVLALAVSPDGRLLASGEDSGRIALWSTDDWTLVGSKRLSHPASALRFAGDEQLVTQRGDRAVVRGVPGLGVIREVGPAGTLEVSTAADAVFAVAGEAISVRRLSDGSRLHGHDEPFDRFWDTALAPDGRAVAVAGMAGRIRVWDLEAQAWRHPGHLSEPVGAVAFSPDGSRLTARSGPWIRHFETAGWSQTGAWEPRRPHVWDASFSREGAWMAVSYGFGGVDLVELATGEGTQLAGPASDSVHAVRFSPVGDLVAATDGSGARTWPVPGPREGRELPIAGMTQEVVPFGQGWLAVGSGTDLSGVLLRRHGGDVLVPDLRWLDMQLTVDGSTLVAHDALGGVAVVDVASGAVARRFGQGDEERAALTLSRDDRLVASGTVSGATEVWELATGRRLGRFEGHEAAVSALDFSSDGRWLASGSVDTTVRIWSLR